MDELLKKVELLNTHFQRTEQTKETRLLQRIVKLNEEVGELCEAALTEVDPNQRKKDKVVDFDAELADVLITVLMLSTGRDKNLVTEAEVKINNVLTHLGIQS